jgi:hypothetical protein
MTDLERFTVLILLSCIAFLAVLAFTLRKRQSKPGRAALAGLTLVVVPCGMLFARYGHILFQLPWWVYYGVPALLTFALPPLTLRMKARETIQYVPLAVLMAPAIHVFASLFLGWHDYMPFPLYIPSLHEIAHRFA